LACWIVHNNTPCPGMVVLTLLFGSCCRPAPQHVHPNTADTQPTELDIPARTACHGGVLAAAPGCRCCLAEAAQVSAAGNNAHAPPTCLGCKGLSCPYRLQQLDTHVHKLQPAVGHGTFSTIPACRRHLHEGYLTAGRVAAAVDCALMHLLQSGSYDFANARAAMVSPLAKKLFLVDGVTGETVTDHASHTHATRVVSERVYVQQPPCINPCPGPPWQQRTRSDWSSESSSATSLCNLLCSSLSGRILLRGKCAAERSTHHLPARAPFARPPTAVLTESY
jgi:Fe-S-cluster-containing dehydrogenase component